MGTQWQRLQSLLPPEKPWTGRPNVDHRCIPNGILWVHRTGAPWRDLPMHYGPVGTVSSLLSRWPAAGIWDQVLIALQSQADTRGEVDCDRHFVYATVIRAHQHAAGTRRHGASEMGRASRRWGTARASSQPSCTCGPRAAASRSSPY